MIYSLQLTVPLLLQDTRGITAMHINRAADLQEWQARMLLAAPNSPVHANPALIVILQAAA
jgi:hypothetical protein